MRELVAEPHTSAHRIDEELLMAEPFPNVAVPTLRAEESHAIVSRSADAALELWLRCDAARAGVRRRSHTIRPERTRRLQA
jgi:hypothetical protein